MNRSKIMLPLALFLGAILGSGCLGGGADLEAPELPVTVAPGVTNVSGELVFDHGNWTDGKWWKAELLLDLGFQFLLEAEGKLVVVPGKDKPFVLSADIQNFGIIDNYFDSFYQGLVDGDLNPVVFGETVRMYDWPVKAGKTWTTKFMSDDFFKFELDTATLRTTTFEDVAPGESPRVRIQGETKWASIDYDYNPDTGWMTYFRLINKTTGRLAVSLDLEPGGDAYEGELHTITSKVLYTAFKMSVPFSPDLAPTPDVVEVPAGYTFLEYIRFVGVFPFFDPPLDLATAGAGAVVIVAPDGSNDPTITEGALEFHGEFERNHYNPYKPGQYEVVYALGGTSGAFVIIQAFKDEKFVA